jgi:transcriptional regulator
MHPNGAFAWTDREAMLSFIGRHAFAHIFSAGEAGLSVVHAPLLVTSVGKLQFHISRRNRAADQIAGRPLLVSAVGREAYQSANWYVSPDQVPTWHYESVEIEGPARELDSGELVDLLDALSQRFENHHSPKKPWSRAKMSGGKFEAMTRAIIGFEIDPVEFRGTRKFNQHKSDEDAAATIAGQAAAGRFDIVEAIMELRGSAS